MGRIPLLWANPYEECLFFRQIPMKNAVFQAFFCVKKICEANLVLLSETPFGVSFRSTFHANLF
jgi:hypothetical protein